MDRAQVPGSRVMLRGDTVASDCRGDNRTKGDKNGSRETHWAAVKSPSQETMVARIRVGEVGMKKEKQSQEIFERPSSKIQ